MKTCPNCGEILGDSINVCFKCRYDFNAGNKIREEQKKIQLAKNPLFEYRIVTVNDLSTGEIDDDKIQKVLNEWSGNGWTLHTIFTNEIGKTSSAASIGGFGAGINATIDQTVLIFERCIKA